MPDNLRIEPGAAERIAQAFDKHADNLAAIAERIRNFSYSTGFAGFPSAVELDAGFKNKAAAAVEHLREEVETSRRYAATLRAAGTAYAESDNSASASLRSAGGNPEGSGAW